MLHLVLSIDTAKKQIKQSQRHLQSKGQTLSRPQLILRGKMEHRYPYVALLVSDKPMIIWFYLRSEEKNKIKRHTHKKTSLCHHLSWSTMSLCGTNHTFTTSATQNPDPLLSHRPFLLPHLAEHSSAYVDVLVAVAFSHILRSFGYDQSSYYP